MENTGGVIDSRRKQFVIEEYLQLGYGGPNRNTLTVCGEEYKVLRRSEVTVFYDATGNTLFEVENEKLADMHEVMKKGGVIDVRDEEIGVPEETEDDTEACETSGEEPEVVAEGDGADDTADVTEGDVEEEPPVPEVDSGMINQRAVKKLEKEMGDAKDKSFAEPVLTYLIGRCRDDEGLSEDVMQKHKTWEKCFKYVYEMARKVAKGNVAAVRSNVVFEWAEDYYHKDDKAEEEKKAKEKAEREKKQKEDQKKRIEGMEKRKAAKEAAPAPKEGAKKEEKPKAVPAEKPKKNNKDMDGQMDLFSLMGM